MKKTLALALALVMTLSLAACGDDEESSSKKKKAKNSSSSSAVESSSQEETTTTTTTSAPETTTTTETTTTETTTTVTEPEKEYSVSAVVGDWYIEGDPTAAHISVHEDGTFESFLASGSLEYEGTVKAGHYDLDDENGGEGDYFCFATDDKGESSFAFYVPYTDAQAVEFTTSGAVKLHFLPAQEPFEMPEGMPYNYSAALNKSNGIDLHIEPNGKFEGLYLDYDLNDKNERVEVFSHFAGFFGPVKDEGDGIYSMKITNITTIKGTPADTSYFANYVGADAIDVSERFGSLGLLTGDTLYLYPQGTKFDAMPADIVKRIKDAEEKDDMISDYYLCHEEAGLAFRSA